jgi:chromate reductase, NAD(P)H dehydrogenase (quinone)
MSPHVITICGSLRAGSVHAVLLAEAEAQLGQLGATVDRFPMDAIPHYNEDHDTGENHFAADLRSRVAAADGLIIATPTYNDAVPSTIKALIDWLSRPWGNSAVAGKRIALITASPGSAAGLTGAEYVQKMAGFLKAEVVVPGTHIGKWGEVIDAEAGTIDKTVRVQISATVKALLA